LQKLCSNRQLKTENRFYVFAAMTTALPMDLARIIIHYLPIELQLFIILRNSFLDLNICPQETCPNIHAQESPRMRIFADVVSFRVQANNCAEQVEYDNIPIPVNQIIEKLTYARCRCRIASLEEQIHQFLNARILTLPIIFHTF
jgi:hypothetical protein